MRPGRGVDFARRPASGVTTGLVTPRLRTVVA